MELSLDRIKSMSFGISQVGFLKEIILDPNTVRKIRDQNSESYFGAWDDVCKLLNDGIDTEIIGKVVDGVNFQTKHVLVNLGYIFPKIFTQHIDEFIEIIDRFSYGDVCKILERKASVVGLYNYIITREVNFLQKNHCFVYLMLFSLKKHSIVTDEEEFWFLLNSLVKISLGTKPASFIDPLFNRMYCLAKREQTTEKKKNTTPLKVAIFVTGQIRSENLNHFSLLYEQLIANTNIVFDVYVSTWKKLGGSDIKVSSLYRSFDSGALDFLNGLDSRSYDNIVKICEHERKVQLGVVREESIKHSFKWASETYCNIEDESEPKFTSMSNDQKMYYHNNYWVEKYGEEKFKEYDLMMKVRPDIKFLEFKLEKLLADLATNMFVTEDHSGWIFRSWGFGVGDQVLVGFPSAIIPLMGAYQNDDVKKIQKEFLNLDPYKGHINLGILAYLKGLECVGNKYFKLMFCAVKKISKEDIENFLVAGDSK